MENSAREIDQSEERVMEQSNEVAVEESKNSRDNAGIRKRRSGAESSGEGSLEPSQRVVVQNENPFFFWLWFMAIVSIVMLIFVAAARVVNRSEKIEILSMPAGVRAHFEAGKLVKVEVGRDRSPVKMFVRSSPKIAAGETALLLHGLGSSSYLYRKLIPLLAARGISAVAVDFPGAGLSEKPYLGRDDDDDSIEDLNLQRRGFLHVRFEALKTLLVEGVFHNSHDESVEHEFLEQLRSATKQNKGKKVLALGPEEMGEALDQIVASLELAPVHLVMHDTGVEVGLAWASQNPTKVASLTLVDSVPWWPSLPFWLFEVPLLGPIIAQSDLAFRLVLRSSCFSSVTTEVAEDHGYLLRSSDGLRALLASLAASNTSMDVAGWAGHSHFGDIPKQILWASGWSKEWQSEGEQLAVALPGASFHSHHGSRWPQEDAAPEIADIIAEFVKSLPSSLQQHIDYETLPNNAELLYEMAKESGNSPRSSHSQDNLGRIHRHHHSHGHELGYMEGLGQAAGVGHGGWVI